jgi:hypothetical protein
MLLRTATEPMAITPAAINPMIKACTVSPPKCLGCG